MRAGELVSWVYKLGLEGQPDADKRRNFERVMRFRAPPPPGLEGVPMPDWWDEDEDPWGDTFSVTA